MSKPALTADVGREGFLESAYVVLAASPESACLPIAASLESACLPIAAPRGPGG